MRELRGHRLTILAVVVAIALGAGWALRERAFAEERVKLLESKTVTQAELKMADHVYEGRPRGEAALYFQGQTAGTRSFVVGQFRLKPGEEPHPIHKHPEEEILIVTTGKGEISCEGKTTKIGPGSVMYTAPDAPHGIKNLGDDTLTFYFVKWIGVRR